MTGPVDRQLLEDSFGRESAREVLQLFVNNMAQMLDRLQSAIEASDHAAGAACAHEISGTASSVGGQEMATCARQLEVMLSAHCDPRALDVLAHLRLLFAEAKKYVEETH